MRFDSYHPVINLIYFVSMFVFTIYFKQPVFLAISFLSSFIYSVKLNGKRALIFNIILLPFIGAYSLWYSYYNHFGVTNLRRNFIGNQITLESLVYGIVIGIIIATVIMWFSCVHAVVSSDKIIYLFGRISPKLSLFFSIILRTVPRIKARAKKINIAQKAIGRGANQGNILRRICNSIRILSMIITWTLENFVESSDSMRSRGYTLKGRTAFSIYRFDNRDRAFVITVFWCMTVILMGILFDQTNVMYNPEIIMNPITPMSFIFYFVYGFYCLLPMILQIAGEIKFELLRSKA